MRIKNILSALLMTSLLTGCIAPAIGTAVETTVEVIEAPFVIAGVVIAAPFWAVEAAIDTTREQTSDDQGTL